MRKPYLMRLADLQAAINQPKDKTPGELIRSFLAHEAATSRNLRKSKLLTPELCSLVSTLDLTTLSGSLPFPPHYTMNTIACHSGQSFTVSIYNQKSAKAIYFQTTSLGS